MIKALQDKSPVVTGRAAAALARFGHQALKDVRATLNTTQPPDYLWAVIGYIGTGQDLPVIQAHSSTVADVSARMIQRRYQQTGFESL